MTYVMKEDSWRLKDDRLTTGTPTPEGYLKLCSHHYFKLRGGR